MKYKLVNDKGKTIFVKPASPDFEHSFDAILRNLAQSCRQRRVEGGQELEYRDRGKGDYVWWRAGICAAS